MFPEENHHLPQTLGTYHVNKMASRLLCDHALNPYIHYLFYLWMRSYTNAQDFLKKLFLGVALQHQILSKGNNVTTRKSSELKLMELAELSILFYLTEQRNFQLQESPACGTVETGSPMLSRRQRPMLRSCLFPHLAHLLLLAWSKCCVGCIIKAELLICLSFASYPLMGYLWCN